MSIKIGSKYFCSSCQSEFIITKMGNADLKCCGKPLDKK